MSSHPGKRGERVVTNVGRDAMDAICVARRAARTRTTKSCGPGAPGLALSFAGDEPAGDGDYEVTDTGESTKISVNTIAQGRPDVSVEPVVSNSCAFFTAHEAAGAASARSSLRPLLFEGRRFSQSLGHAVSREGRRASALRVERSNPKRSRDSGASSLMLLAMTVGLFEILNLQLAAYAASTARLTAIGSAIARKSDFG
jgi:hypothetical protein